MEFWLWSSEIWGKTFDKLNGICLCKQSFGVIKWSTDVRVRDIVLRNTPLIFLTSFFNMVSEKMRLFVIRVNPPSQKHEHTLGAGAVSTLSTLLCWPQWFYCTKSTRTWKFVFDLKFSDLNLGLYSWIMFLHFNTCVIGSKNGFVRPPGYIFIYILQWI